MAKTRYIVLALTILVPLRYLTKESIILRYCQVTESLARPQYKTPVPETYYLVPDPTSANGACLPPARKASATIVLPARNATVPTLWTGEGVCEDVSGDAYAYGERETRRRVAAGNFGFGFGPGFELSWVEREREKSTCGRACGSIASLGASGPSQAIRVDGQHVDGTFVHGYYYECTGWLRGVSVGDYSGVSFCADSGELVGVEASVKFPLSRRRIESG
ncbi:hypothetical protein K438DRAFT_1752587 [Mycena galopus ATCC 62051]|nr:hypothetical protein K438DRAFT_1752587 [Mycena galopus ATCC 62051]